MRAVVFAFGVGALGLCLASTDARADVPPPANKGFQLALRTGAAIPIGEVRSGFAMADALSVQLPFLVDLGFKPIPALFIGVYLGAAVGGATGAVEQQCNSVGISCTGVGFRGGLQVQYNFLPAQRINPWVGYGFGYELGGSNGSNGDRSVSNSYRGFELGHILAGADIRLQDYFGIGPFLDAAMGQYDAAKNETNDGGYISTLGGKIDDKAMHAWIIVGVRAVLLP